jgi:hypothetical protein
MKRQRNKRGLVATLFLAGILGTSAYAFTASNTINDAGHAGDGNGPGSITGYDVTNVHYDSVGGTNIESVKFDIDPAVDPATGSVKAALNGAALSDCGDASAGAGTTYLCDVSAALPAVSILASDTLRVVAFG